MKKNFRSMWVLGVAVLGLVLMSSCSDEPTGNSGNNDKDTEFDEYAVLPGKAVPVAIGLTAEERVALDKIQQLSLDMFNELAQKDESSGAGGNVMISPYSLANVLSMLVNSSDGSTREQLMEMYCPGVSVETLNSLNYKLLVEVSTQDEKFQMKSANSLWFDNDIELKSEIVSIFHKYYLTKAHKMDFSDGKGVVDAVNAWASKITNGLIDNVLQEAPSKLSLVMANALYFKGEWTVPFNPENTKKGKFTRNDGSNMDVRMMRDIFKMYGLNEDGCTYLFKDYGNTAYKAVFILPDEGKSLSSVRASLTSDRLRGLSDRAQLSDYVLEMPKFKTNVEKNKLRPLLMARGCEKLFSVEADFSPLTNSPLYVNEINQYTTVMMDEMGSEGAAVTIVDMFGAIGSPSDPIQVTLDRPFIFAIQESWTGAIIMIGQISNPQIADD